MARLKRFLKDLSGSTAIEYGLLVSLLSLALLGALALTGERTRDLFERLSIPFGSNAVSGVTWSSSPDFNLARRPGTLAHDTFWVAPFTSSDLPEGLEIGGQQFEVIGDGNPRLLIAGADPGPSGTYDPSNYASSGVAFVGSQSPQWHRLIIDRPAPGQSHSVQLHINGQVIEYTLTAPNN